MCSQTRHKDRYGRNRAQKVPKGGTEMSVNKECNNLNTTSRLNMQTKRESHFHSQV